MADEDEERVLEEQLQFQLKEQKDSLAAVADALSSDPSNPELLSVHVELVQAIKDAEEGLFQLKRARLLREADSILEGSLSSDNVKVEPLDPTDVEAEPLVDQSFSIDQNVDSVILMDGGTTGSLLVWKALNLQRYLSLLQHLKACIDIPISSLKKYITTKWEQSLVGSSIWALSDCQVGIWREAELESWDEKLKMGEVVFRDNGSSSKLGTESITLSEYAQMSNDEETDSSSEQSDSSDYEDDSPQGLGFLESTNLQKGVQTDTAIFATNGSRCIRTGILDPISVKVLPPKQSLNHAVKNTENEENKETRLKKRTRGGKRKRDKKLAAAIKAAEEEEESKDVFSLINTQLASVNGRSAKKQQNKANGEAKKEDRRALLAYEDEMKNLRLQIERLEEMVNRNRKEKVVCLMLL
ncbi:hypothetical protein DH2020_049349 [Rehmannia glutinosa]|uniref:Uncharacterized protein n=1 Tax=Rehmannia glutinosa TaxID=99300 RepID=A0ABR0U3D0_REHGL